MDIFNRGLERFIVQISKDKPTQVEVSTDFTEGGEVTYVCEYFGVFTSYYEDRKPVTAKKKYGGTTSTPEEMDIALDKDIQRLQELDISVFKTKGFQDEAN